jgi:hypothetical protein
VLQQKKAGRPAKAAAAAAGAVGNSWTQEEVKALQVSQGWGGEPQALCLLRSTNFKFSLCWDRAVLAGSQHKIYIAHVKKQALLRQSHAISTPPNCHTSMAPVFSKRFVSGFVAV